MGREIARRWRRAATTVLVTDVEPRAPRSETAELLGERAWPMAHDVRDPDAHRAVARRGRRARPAQGVGQQRRHPAHRKGVGAYRRGGPADGRGQPARRHLGLARGGRGDARHAAGHIINMASMSSFGPVPGWPSTAPPSTRCSASRVTAGRPRPRPASRSACTRSARTASTPAWSASDRPSRTRRSSSRRRKLLRARGGRRAGAVALLGRATRSCWRSRASRCLRSGAHDGRASPRPNLRMLEPCSGSAAAQGRKAAIAARRHSHPSRTEPLLTSTTTGSTIGRRRRRS